MGIYGIQGSFSRQLQETAGWVKTLPTEEEQHGFEYRLIFDTLKTSGTMLTEGTLINSITQNNKNVKKQNIQSALEKMKADGYISECSIGKKNSATKPSLFVDWDKVNNNLFVSEV